jgi:hypothetical protein
VTAIFTLLPVHLTVRTSGTGGGTVTTSPAGIDCGSTCGADYVNGATVTLLAIAAPGSSFIGWTGACSGTSATCTVSLSVARSVMANFALLPNHLSVTTSGTGTGSVTSTPDALDCGATCDADFAGGATVTLTALAAPGSSFTGWTGACSGAATTCTLSLDAARSVTAIFTADPLPLAPLVYAGAPPALPIVALAPLLHSPVVAPLAVTVPTVKARPALSARPKIAGRARAGSTLICSPGVWNGSPTRYVLTWRRDGQVAGHGSSYRLRAADRGHSMRCSVTASNATGAATAASGVVRVARAS